MDALQRQQRRGAEHQAQAADGGVEACAGQRLWLRQQLLQLLRVGMQHFQLREARRGLHQRQPALPQHVHMHQRRRRDGLEQPRGCSGRLHTARPTGRWRDTAARAAKGSKFQSCKLLVTPRIDACSQSAPARPRDRVAIHQK